MCHRPADRLRPLNQLVPVGAVRKIVPATIARLSSHSEDWNRLRPDTVEPKVVLTPVLEQNLDFYENRVAARLVDHLWREVGQRLTGISKIDVMLGGVNRYVAETVARPWRLQDTLFELIKGLAGKDRWRELAAVRRRELTAYCDALIALRGQGILPGVDRDAEIGIALRATNLFTNEGRYRRVWDLWQAWADVQAGVRGEASPAERLQAFCRGFASYTALLVLHALEHLNALGSEPDAGPLRPGGTPVTVAMAGFTGALRWLPSDVLEISAAGRPVLRIVPLAHAITAGSRPAAVTEVITQLTSGDPAVPTLIVYPGSEEERDVLPVSVRLACFTGCDAPLPQLRKWRLLPVSPMEIDSVMRVARSLRSVLEKERHRYYPVSLPASQEQALVAAEGTSWLAVRPGEFVIVRPPQPGECAAATARLRLASSQASRNVGQVGQATPLEALAATLPPAAERAAGFATCPVCQYRRPDPWRSLRPRTGGTTYACSCDQCKARWELRPCACGESFPVVIPKQGTEPGGLDGDALDRRFGSQLTAAPCWLRPSVFICTSCGMCSEANKNKGATCGRCQRRDGQAPNPTGRQ